jgi:hypothetical protein
MKKEHLGDLYPGSLVNFLGFIWGLSMKHGDIG